VLFDHGWNSILPGYNNHPPSYRRIIPFLLASLVYHHFTGDLAALYPPDHSIFAQPLFTNQDLLNYLRDKVILVHSYCPDAKMSAQGVPGFITIQREIRQFRKYYDETVAINIGKFSELHASMVAMFSSLPQQVISLLLERIRVEGAREVTIEDIRALIMETLQSPFGPFTQISDQLRRMEARMGSESQAAVSSEQQQGNPLQFSTPAGGSFFYWPGIDSRFHRVPYGFKFPSYVTGTMWNLWFFGDLSRKIGPYKHITPANDLPNSGCRSNACRTKLVIKKMVEIAADGH